MTFPWGFFDDPQGIIARGQVLRFILDDMYKEGRYPALLKEADRLHDVARERIRTITTHLMDDEAGLTRIADVARSINNQMDRARSALKLQDFGPPRGGDMPINFLGYVLAMINTMDMTISLLPKEKNATEEVAT